MIENVHNNSVNLNSKRCKVGIVILNYNTWQDTIKVFEDLRHQEGVDLYVVVVDNGSPNDSNISLKKYFEEHPSDKVIYYSSDKNLGYARGNNIGLNLLEKFNCDFTVVMNNDVYFEDKNLLKKLSDVYRHLNKPGFIAPKTRNIDGSWYIESYKIPSFIDDFLFGFRFLNLLYRKFKHKPVHIIEYEPKEVEVFSGSFLFIDSSLFRCLGYFDEATFLYGEERLWSKKAILNGRINYIIPTLNFTHAHSKTIKQYVNKSRQFRYLYDSRIIYTEKYRTYPKIKKFLLKLSFRWSLIEIYVYDLFKTKYK